MQCIAMHCDLQEWKEKRQRSSESKNALQNRAIRLEMGTFCFCPIIYLIFGVFKSNTRKHWDAPALNGLLLLLLQCGSFSHGRRTVLVIYLYVKRVVCIVVRILFTSNWRTIEELLFAFSFCSNAYSLKFSLSGSQSRTSVHWRNAFQTTNPIARRQHKSTWTNIHSQGISYNLRKGISVHCCCCFVPLFAGNVE